MQATEPLARRAPARGSGPLSAAAALRALFAAMAVTLRRRTCVASLLLSAMLLGAVLGGRSLLWCRWMQQVQSQCCCLHEDASAAPEGPAVERSPCCETQLLPVFQAARTEPSERCAAVGPAPSAPLPAAGALVAPLAVTAVVARAREREARAGPDVPLYDLHCTYLI